MLISSDFYYNVLNGIMKVLALPKCSHINSMQDNVNLLHSAVQLYSLFEKDQLSPPFPHLFWVVQSASRRTHNDICSSFRLPIRPRLTDARGVPAVGAAAEGDRRRRRRQRGPHSVQRGAPLASSCTLCFVVVLMLVLSSQ